MEFDAVTTKQLVELANSEDTLRRHFAGVYAADTLPKTPGVPRPAVTSSIPILTANPDAIGLPYGPRETFVKSWTVTVYP